EYFAILYDWMERPADAVAEAQRGVDNDPLSVNATTELASALMFAKRYDEAVAELARLRDVQPPVRRVSIITREILGAKGLWTEAIATFPGQRNAGAAARMPAGRFRGRALARASTGGEGTLLHADLKP